MTVITTSNKQRRSPRNGILIALLVVVAIIGTVLFMVSRTSKPHQPTPPPISDGGTIEAHKPEKAPAKSPEETAKPTTTENQVDAPVAEQQLTEPDKTSEPPKSTRPKTPEELGLPIHDKEEKQKIRKSFDTNTERIISGFANTKRGYAPPPLLNLPMGENLMEILERDIVIYDDDDEKVQKAKENCAALKEELKKYIADGGTAENFLSWYHNELTKDFNTWKESQMYIVELMKQGMVTEADEYMAKANEALEKAGIRTVTIPENLRKLGESKLKELQEKGQ